MNFDTSNFFDNFFNASPSRIADAPLKFIVLVTMYCVGKCAIEELSKMVQEVNQTQIEPEERLTDQAYVIEV